MRGDPCIDGLREPMDPWNMVQPCDPVPVSKAAYDLIGRVRTNMDGVVGRNQTHARVEVVLSKFRESFDDAFRLRGNELKRGAPIPAGDSSHPAATERTVTVVYQGRPAAQHGCQARVPRWTVYFVGRAHWSLRSDAQYNAISCGFASMGDTVCRLHGGWFESRPHRQARLERDGHARRTN